MRIRTSQDFISIYVTEAEQEIFGALVVVFLLSGVVERHIERRKFMMLRPQFVNTVIGGLVNRIAYFLDSHFTEHFRQNFYGLEQMCL